MGKLQWELQPQANGQYALLLREKPDSATWARITDHFEKVKTAPGGRHPHINQEIARGFEAWLAAPAQPLGFKIYATLSNWFTTGAWHYRHSPLAKACKELWAALGFAPLTQRLTIADSVICSPAAFDAWWARQQSFQAEQEA